MTQATPQLEAPRRGLTFLEAAVYVRVSPDKFTALMDSGRMPQPRLVDEQRVWDVRELDIYFDALPRDGRSARQRQPGSRRQNGQIEPA